MTRIARVRVSAAFICGSSVAAGQVYRCDKPDGVTYADISCSLDARPFEMTPANILPAQRYGALGVYANSAPTAGPATRPSRRDLEPTPGRAPNLRCPDNKTIAVVNYRRTVVRCITTDQVRRATPHGLSGHEVSKSFDESGPFTEWRYAVIRAGWPARIQFCGGQVFGYETLPYHARD